MRTLKEIALDVYVCAKSWDPGVRLIGNVTAAELAALAKDFEEKALTEPETVICSAIRMPDGYIVRGHRHSDCIHTAHQIPRYRENWECPYGDDQGFVSSKGRYVTREEALELQKAASIPCFKDNGYRSGEYHPRQLFSEDLY